MKKLLFAALAGSPMPAAAGEIDVALDMLDTHATVQLPELSTSDLARLERGETATVVKADRVAALTLVEADLVQAWATVHDPRVTGDPAVLEVRLSADAAGTELWYGRMELPRPLSDREWVVRSRVNTSLHESSGGRAWERAWQEVPDGLSLARPALAAGHLPGVSVDALGTGVFTPVNRGGWLIVQLESGRSLVAYHARTDLGGSVPVWLVRDVARGQLKGLMDRVRRGVGRPHPEVLAGSGVR